MSVYWRMPNNSTAWPCAMESCCYVRHAGLGLMWFQRTGKLAWPADVSDLVLLVALEAAAILGRKLWSQLCVLLHVKLAIWLDSLRGCFLLRRRPLYVGREGREELLILGEGC